jgi:hypothetical protein
MAGSERMVSGLPKPAALPPWAVEPTPPPSVPLPKNQGVPHGNHHLRPDLVRRRPAARQFQAIRIRPGHPALHILRRLDGVLEATKPQVLREYAAKQSLPRVSDGSLLFLLHLIAKMRPKAQGGGRIGIVLNGSPLFTGGAGSGESEIRRWIIENDWLEAIVALPTDMFYNTGIATYVWLVTNHNAPARRGKIQLINASDFYQKMRKSLGSKRKELGEADLKDLSAEIMGLLQEVTA